MHVDSMPLYTIKREDGKYLSNLCEWVELFNASCIIQDSSNRMVYSFADSIGGKVYFLEVILHEGKQQ